MAAAGTADALQLCYLRHAYGMGEHFNSLTAAQTDSLEDDFQPVANGHQIHA